MSLEKILIVDDEESILNQLRWGLAGEYEVLTASNMEEARRMMRDERPSIVTLDVTLGPPSAGPEGMDLLDEIVERHPLTKVIMVTGNDSRENAIASIRRGAVDSVKIWKRSPQWSRSTRTLAACSVGRGMSSAPSRAATPA